MRARLLPLPTRVLTRPRAARRRSSLRDGHYVRVSPTPLKHPRIVTYSKCMARELDIDDDVMTSPEMVRILSAGTDRDLEPWATPYAVSVMGNEIPSPDAFRGDGYGDGRAISLGEFVGANAQRWELQLKGAGTTPFSRQFDGRAVLRSSIREFLVSEAMHNLRVPTTRALSLVMSDSGRSESIGFGPESSRDGSSEYVARAWYEENERSKPTPPNSLVLERCAITCRASSSFVRVGSLELFARRLRRAIRNDRDSDQKHARRRLEELFYHSCRREFSVALNELDVKDMDTFRGRVDEVVPAVLQTFAERQVELVTHWIRCGYVQGNMNSDNCLLSGATMDYGPFGFIEKYDPTWTPFTSDPMKNCGFERQPIATHLNTAVFCRALSLLVSERVHSTIDEIVNDAFPSLLYKSLASMRAQKLGLRQFDAKLWTSLIDLMTAY